MPKGQPKPNLGVVAVESSENAKIGRASATYVSQHSCPVACPFYKTPDNINGSACYASRGHIGFTTRRLNGSGVTDLVELATMEAAKIDAMDPTLDLRVHVVGDCSTDKSAQIVSGSMGRWSKRSRGRSTSWTYTHAWRTVEFSSWSGVNVIASCESVEDVTLARSRGYLRTAIVFSEPLTTRRRFALTDEIDVIPCPNQSTAGKIKCTDCRLCLDRVPVATGYRGGDMSVPVIGFSPDGSTGKAVKAALG